MSTRALYTFVDNEAGFKPNEQYHVYKHYDGYPTGGLESIEAAKPYAWRLPRFEADEFSAAFVAANKKGIDPLYPNSQGGDLRLMPSGPWKEVAPLDIEYRYEISLKDNALHVQVWSVNCSNWYSSPPPIWAENLLFEGELSQAILHFKETASE